MNLTLLVAFIDLISLDTLSLSIDFSLELALAISVIDSSPILTELFPLLEILMSAVILVTSLVLDLMNPSLLALALLVILALVMLIIVSSLLTDLMDLLLLVLGLIVI